jgi:hypothetical protein
VNTSFFREILNTAQQDRRFCMSSFLYGFSVHVWIDLQVHLRLNRRYPLFQFQNYDIKQPKENAADYFFTQSFPVTMPPKFASPRAKSLKKRPETGGVLPPWNGVRGTALSL